MHKNYTFAQEFSKNDFTKTSLLKGDYEQCQFIYCNLNGVDLNDFNFIQCEFIGCDLSLTQINGTSFQDVIFTECKMIGFSLEVCNKFGLKVKFTTCILNDSSFYNLQLQKIHFKNCALENVDFAYADLSQAYFENCNLKGSIFDQTNLEKANLITAENFSINPTQNKIKNTHFSKENCIGLLDTFQIKID
ncbi:pentapeptide repeat-containing protein [Faecalibacter rhinopitheci]|uniref:Pentapeptide repeat-containing protein n=1 Tax=Faecalibacter rhinopitheci TaxID=2779678 RepID=A0A8J7FPP5_9FLAO|nr:pentapeptide repeat-containing protein [Faecalibacter rhinopitheci]MBF0597149.1 pentapeptide repeat-containing protein [Faecalibacter rhinopitheci]MBQ0148488.1 pentapeptide repeat-containing protein [Candidatus Onthonaster equi]